MPALLRSLEQFINKPVCVRVCVRVHLPYSDSQSVPAVLIRYVRYAKTYLYSHNSVCGFQYEKENRNYITIAFGSLTNVSVFLFVWLFGLLFALISDIANCGHATKCVCLATNVS